MNFVAFVKSNASERLQKVLPRCNQEVKDCRGKMATIMDYEAGVLPCNSIWDEGYRYWWRFSNVSHIEKPFMVRDDVGMRMVYR